MVNLNNILAVACFSIQEIYKLYELFFLMENWLMNSSITEKKTNLN